MDLITLLLVVALAGFLVYLITEYIPMPAPFKTAIIVIAVIVMVLYVLRVLGVGLPNVLR